MYRVMLVEKDRLMLSKLSAVIERTPGFTMAVRYQSKQDALGQGRMFDPNLILLESTTRMPSHSSSPSTVLPQCRHPRHGGGVAP